MKRGDSINVFYIDRFLLKNIFLNMGIIIMNFQLIKIPVRKRLKWIMASSLLGSVLNTIILLSVRNYYVYSFLSLVIIMPLVLMLAMGKIKVRYIFMLYAVTFLLGGVMSMMENWKIYDESGWIKLLTGIMVAQIPLFILTVTIKQCKNMYKVELKESGEKFLGTAIYDTGNRLREPYGNRRVHIIGKEAMKKLHVKEGYMLVPYSSIGRKNGLIKVYEIESIRLNNNGKIVELKNELFGLDEDEILTNKPYEIILNENIFDEGA